VHPLGWAVMQFGVFCVASFLLFRRLDTYVLTSRLGFFLEIVVPFLIFGVANVLLGVSASRPITIPVLLATLGISILAGIPLSIAMLSRRRAIALNVVALIAAAGWFVFFLVGFLGFGLFSRYL
jgi:hypothetical protein